MISEVDIRDWEKVDFQPLEYAAEVLHNEGYNSTASDLQDVIDQLIKLRNRYTGQVPALFKPKKA